ncbi:hypothetical protein E2320_014338, partial [Naja naja]
MRITRFLPKPLPAATGVGGRSLKEKVFLCSPVPTLYGYLVLLLQGLFVDASNDFPKIKKETPSDAEQRQFFKQILENEDAVLQGNEKSLMRPPNMSAPVCREGSASAQPDLVWRNEEEDESQRVSLKRARSTQEELQFEGMEERPKVLRWDEFSLSEIHPFQGAMGVPQIYPGNAPLASASGNFCKTPILGRPTTKNTF